MKKLIKQCKLKNVVTFEIRVFISVFSQNVPSETDGKSAK